MAKTVRLQDGTTVTRFWSWSDGLKFEVSGNYSNGVLLVSATDSERRDLAALFAEPAEEPAPRPRSLFERAAALVRAQRAAALVTE